MIRRPPRSPLFPYPALFRSHPPPQQSVVVIDVGIADAGGKQGADPVDLALLLGDVRLDETTRMFAAQRARKLQLLRRRGRSEEHTPELQSPCNLACRLLLEK